MSLIGIRSSSLPKEGTVAYLLANNSKKYNIYPVTEIRCRARGKGFCLVKSRQDDEHVDVYPTSDVMKAELYEVKIILMWRLIKPSKTQYTVIDVWKFS